MQLQKKKNLMFFLILPLFFLPFLLYSQVNHLDPKSQLNDQFLNELSKEKDTFIKSEKENFQKGEENFFKGRYNTSEILFKKVLEMNPENAFAHSYLGDIYFYQSHLDKAIYHYHTSMELRRQKVLKNLVVKNKEQENTFFLKEFFRLAQIYYVKKEFDKSKEYFNLILKNQPDFFQCFYYLAMINYLEKKYDVSLEWFEKYKKNLEIYAEQKKDTDLKEEIEKINKIIVFLKNPILPNTENILKEELNPRELINQKKENLSVDNSNKIPKESYKTIPIPAEKKKDPLWIEIEFYRLNDKQKSIQLLEKYKNSDEIKTSQDHFFIRNTLCSIFIEKEEWEKAEKECKEALKYDAQDETLFNLAIINNHLNQDEAFLYYLEKYLKKNPLNIEANFYMGKFFFEKQKYPDSLLYFTKILSLQPNHKQSFFYQFLNYKELNQIELMKNTAYKIILYYPEDWELQTEIAKGFLEKNELEESEKILKEIYKKNQSIDIGLILSGIKIQKNEWEAAFSILSELYNKYPENYQVVKTIILILLKMEKGIDTIEPIVRKYYNSGASQEEKNHLLNYLPEEIKIKITEPTQKEEEKK